MISAELAESQPGAHVRLIELAAAALVRKGARVRVDPRGENLVRRPRMDDPGGARVIVEAQGLGNLMHELVHIVRAGVLDDDHGIDYGQMPFRLDDPAHRSLLWDELAACVVSCAYATADAPDAWFAEQVETQPVFYGMEADPGAFVRAVDALVGADGPCRDELERVIESTYTQTRRWLAEVGASAAEAAPARDLRFAELWRTYVRSRSDWVAPVAGGR